MASTLGHALALGFGCYFAAVGAVQVLIGLLRRGVQDGL